MKQKIDNEIYAEKTIATYETKYRDNPLSKPQEIVLTITAGHLYGKAFVCEQVATKEEDIFYSKFSASISDIANITINTYIKEYPIYISFEKPSKDNKYAKDRKRIILPSFENPENIVAQITETKEKLDSTKKKKPAVTEEQFALDYSETVKTPKKSGIDDIINVWDNITPQSDENLEIMSEPEVIEESIEEQAGSLEFESEVNFSEEADEFIEEEQLEEIRTPPIAPAPPAFINETVFDTEEIVVEVEETPVEAEDITENADETPEVAEETPTVAEEIPDDMEEIADDTEETPDNTEEIADDAAEMTEETEEIIDAVLETPDEIAEEVLFETVRTAARAEKPEYQSPEIELPTPVINKPTSAEPAPAAPAPSTGSKLSSLESFEESMKKLKIMYESGVITLEEFNAEKKNILKTLY